MAKQASSEPVMLSIQDLKRTYHNGKISVEALRGVSFEVKKGEFLAIMGRSGSGKSTLLHQLGLIDDPTSGNIYIEGEDVAQFSDQKKTEYRLEHFGHVFQEYALLPELTALENVLLPAIALPGNHDEERAKELLRLVGMGERLDHYPHELSGGEQQRVAIARALVNSPKILFADEPTANLDTISAEVVLELFRKLNKDLKQTILMITHESDDKKYVDRVIFLKDGLIESEE
jgi:putative ABC transport system ATP-binding protein